MRYKAFLLFTLLGLFGISDDCQASYQHFSIQGTAGRYPISGLAGVVLPLQVIELKANNAESFVELSPITVIEKAPPTVIRICSASNLVTPGYLKYCNRSGEELFRMDVSLASYYQWFEHDMDVSLWKKIRRDGLRIYFVSEQAVGFKLIVAAEKAKLFEPHVYIPSKDSKQTLFLKHFASLNAINSYGWQSGCVLDGLAALAKSHKYGHDSIYHHMLVEHLRLYFPQGSVKKLTSVENTPSIAQLALWNPQHPEIERTLAFWNTKRDSLGGINGSKVVAEGCYTVAWPLAVLAKQLNRPDLAQDAILQLRIRRDRLVDSTGLIWLRNSAEKPDNRTYKIWSRGLAWYFLGLAKTLDVLDNPPQDLIQEYRRTAALMLQYQNDKGVWFLFANDSTTTMESSGTAGIAAAWAIGIRRGWIDASYKKPLKKALVGFQTQFLTRDGLVRGVAPNNKAQGGEAFQRASHGVLLQFGMGLYAMLLAEYDGIN
jgi:rhamnogalacturonyl hydrolase YesR